MCGKSAQCYLVINSRGKPYLEQDQAACTVFRSGLNMRVDRIDKWLLIIVMIQNPAYCLPLTDSLTWPFNNEASKLFLVVTF